MKGKNISTSERSIVASLRKSGHTNKSISEQTSLAYSTVCKLTSKQAGRNKQKKNYAVAVDKKVYDYVTSQSEKTSTTRSEVMTEIVRLSQRKRWLFF